MEDRLYINIMSTNKCKYIIIQIKKKMCRLKYNLLKTTI